MALNITINNEDKSIIVKSLKWDETKGEYVPFSSGHMRTVKEEVQQIFDSVWVNDMDTVGFATDTNIMDIYHRMSDDMLYTVDMYYRAGRYQSPTDMAFVANSAIDFIWKYLQMDKYYSEEEDNANKFVF